MNQLSYKLQQGIQLFKQNQKFKQLIQYNPKTISISISNNINTIPIASLDFNHNVNINLNDKSKNNSILPSINNIKMTIRERTKSQIRIKRSETVAHLSNFNKNQENVGNSNNNNITNRKEKRLSSRQHTRSYKNLKNNNRYQDNKQQNNNLNNFNIMISQKNIHITPSKNNLNLANQNSINNLKSTDKKGIQSTSRQTAKSKGILMENLMKQLNQQLILNVKFYTLQENAAYKGFLIFYKSKEALQNQFSQVQHIIKLIKNFITKYKIQSGMIQGKQLGKLINKKVLSNFQIINTFMNKNQIMKNCKIHGLKYYQDFNSKNKNKGQNLAAVKITSLFKMIADRKYAVKFRSLMKKVKIIQKIWKNCLQAKRMKKKILQSISSKMIKAQKLTERMIENWQIIKSSSRVQIHVSSYCMEQFKRLTISEFQHHQNTQITRIFRAIQNDVTVIYVTSIMLSQQIMKYYQRIFAMNNASMHGKLYIIYPQNLDRLPLSLTTVSTLLYSPKALKRIKNLVESLNSSKSSFIIPSYPSVQFTNLSAQLNIPLFSISPNKHKLFSNKSFFRSILERASIPTLKSLHSIYSQKQIVNSLAILIFKNPQIKKWYLKIDDQIRGRGIAIVNCQSFPFFKRLRGINSDQTIPQQLSQKDMIILIADQLTTKLKKKLKILNKQVYPNYNQFMAHLATRGCVIQAETTGRTIQYSISFLIEPNGQFKILGTYHKLQLGGRILQGGIKSPARIIYESNSKDSNSISKNKSLTQAQDYLTMSNQPEKIVRNLYKQIYIHLKMFGYFTIDLLHQQSSNTSYGIGMDCFLNQQTSSLFALQFCSQSIYQKDLNSILKIKKEEVKLETQTSAQSFDNSHNDQHKNNKSQEVHYIYCPIIKIPNMPHINTFFKKCKYGNISFDLQEKLGVMFLLLDNLQSGVVGVMCAQKSQQALFGSVGRMAQYLAKQFVYSKKGDSRNHNKKDDLNILKGMTIVMSRKSKNKSHTEKQQVNLQNFF